MCLALFLILIVHWSDRMFLLHFRILRIPGMGDQLHCLEQRGFWANIIGGALVLKSLPTPSLKQARGKEKRKKKNRQGRPLVAACISRWTHTAQRHKSWMLWAWDRVGYRKGSNRAIGCLMAESQTPPQGPHSGRVCPRQWVGSLYMVLMKSGWLSHWYYLVHIPCGQCTLSPILTVMTTNITRRDRQTSQPPDGW